MSNLIILNSISMDLKKITIPIKFLSNNNVTKKILNDYKEQLSKCTNLQNDIINKVVFQYLDTRSYCGSCNQKNDFYNFLSNCDNCDTKFCSSCFHLDVTFEKYTPCNVDNCYSCSSGSLCDNETSKTYCIPCKDNLFIDNIQKK